MRQELLQRSFDHIMKQGKPSIDGDTCMYKSDKGASCAAAIFILEYKDTMEGMSWNTLATRYRYELDSDAFKESFFVSTVLQRAHDIAASDNSNGFIERYKRELKTRIRVWNEENEDNIRLPEGF